MRVFVFGFCFLANCDAVQNVLHLLWLALVICLHNLWEHFTAPSAANGLSESCRKGWFCLLILRAMMVALFVSFLDLFWIYVWPRVWKSCYKSRNICWGFMCCWLAKFNSRPNYSWWARPSPGVTAVTGEWLQGKFGCWKALHKINIERLRQL